MKDDLQKSDSCGLKSERKKILTSSTCSLACLSTNLGAFCPMVVHLPSEKSILPYFSGPRGVAILDCDSHSQAGSTRVLAKFLKIYFFYDLEMLTFKYCRCDQKHSQVDVVGGHKDPLHRCGEVD